VRQLFFHESHALGHRHIGRSYRLPSAAALEFAARASVDADRGADRMGGWLAEMVAECWPSDVPAT
jgi:formylglycine-generating enzyme required for sulfatase activity